MMNKNIFILCDKELPNSIILELRNMAYHFFLYPDWIRKTSEPKKVHEYNEDEELRFWGEQCGIMEFEFYNREEGIPINVTIEEYLPQSHSEIIYAVEENGNIVKNIIYRTQ